MATTTGMTSFVYDGDGQRVKKKEQVGAAITTTLYVGALEVLSTTQRITKTYYAAGSHLVAMRVVTSTGGNSLYYLVTDHLGSTAVTMDSNGNVVGELRYYAYGATRASSGATPTSRRFTGQYEESGIGLYFYGARYYSSLIGRFVSADSIVPRPGNPHALNRYSYGLNNPIKYTDPTGHRECDLDCQKRNEKVDRETIDQIWSSRPVGLLSSDVGDFLSKKSTNLQDVATAFSSAGAALEIGGMTLGALFGTGPGTFIAGPGVGSTTGGVAGLGIGGAVGNILHQRTTNIAEEIASSASTGLIILADLFEGNSRIDVYPNHVNVVVGEATATSTALTLAGNASLIGITDAAIDLTGSLYSHGILPGVYRLVGAAGKTEPLFIADLVRLQYGDK